MFDRLTRRGLLGSLLAGLLGLVRPAAAVAAAGCPHPAHQPLCADRPGRGRWYRVRLRLTCPRCGAAVYHRGYLPGPATAFGDLLGAPGDPVRLPRVTSFSYGAGSPLAGLISVTTYDANNRVTAVQDRRLE